MMERAKNSNKGQQQDSLVKKRALVFISLCFLFFILARLHTVFIPFTMAALLYFAIKPLMVYVYENWRFHSLLISASTFFGAGLIIGIFILLVAGSLDVFISYIKSNQAQLNDLFLQTISSLNNLGLDIDKQKLLSEVSPGALMSYVGNLTSEFLSLTSSFILFTLFFIFFVFSCNYQKPAQSALFTPDMTKKLVSYISVKLIASFSTGLIVGFALWLIGFELFLPIAVITILLNFIPNIGSLVAVIIPLPIAYLQFGFSSEFFIVLFFLSAVQFSIGNLVEPKFMGNALQMPPVSVIFSLVFWSVLWGVAGMFLAAPMTAIIILMFSKYESTSYIAQVLKGERPDFL